jgi:hypothetical protein
MPGGGSSTTTGGMSVAEGGDIFAGLGVTAITATIGPAEGGDVGALAGVCITAAVSDTEGGDLGALAGAFGTFATIGPTEGHDTLAGIGGDVASGSIVATAGNDTAAIAAMPVSFGLYAATEGADGFAGAGMFTASGSIAVTEGHDVGALAALFAVSGSIAVTEGHDLGALAGVWGSAASPALTEGADVGALAGMFTAAVVLADLEGHDLGALAGATTASASMGATEGGDSLVGFSSGLEYHVYSNTGIGDPINYSSIIATTGLLEWTSGPLTVPGTWRFGVRAFSPVTGLEEQNLDCSITLILDASGNDITNRPKPPTALRAFATAGGGIRVEWAYNTINPSPVPTGFNVYIGTGGTPSYGSPAATVPFAASIGATFVSNVGPLTSGITYTVGVRAFNGVAEDPNTTTVNVVPVSAGPTAVVDLTGGAIV